MTSYLEQLQTDPALRAFVDGQLAQAGIDVHTAKVELERAREVMAAQQREIQELRARLDEPKQRKRKA